MDAMHGWGILWILLVLALLVGVVAAATALFLRARRPPSPR